VGGALAPCPRQFGNSSPRGRGALDSEARCKLDPRAGALLIKLPAERVRQLIEAGHGQPFTPAGRTFREWVAITVPDRQRWQDLLTEARDHAAAAR